MTYTATFYTFDVMGREIMLTTHRVHAMALAAYRDAPAIALAAARSVKDHPKPQGYRVVDCGGSIVLDYRDKNYDGQ